MKSKNIIVTGPKSMIGQALMFELMQSGHSIYPFYHDNVDLLDYKETLKAFNEIQPNIVYHLAGFNGGIQFNKKYPDEIFYKTVQMGLNVLNCSQIHNATAISVLASCSYPNIENDVLKETELWNGLPNPTVECHGLAKRFLHAYGKQINKKSNPESGFRTSEAKSVSVVMTNCFGPGDSYDVNKTKVVGGMFKKFHQAKIKGEDIVECWGTGKPLRELLYSYDAGKALYNIGLDADLLESYPELINLGTPNEISIKDLAEKIAQVVGYEGKIVWDDSKPDGQMRKKLDLRLFNTLYPNFEYTDFTDALVETYNEDKDKMQ